MVHCCIVAFLCFCFVCCSGLCHAYWAPNVWSWYVAFDLVAKRAVRILKIPYFLNLTDVGSTTSGLVQVTSLSVLPNIQPVVTFAITFIFIVPVLWKVGFLLHSNVLFCLCILFVCVPNDSEHSFLFHFSFFHF